jgi:hypothetical protein
VYRHAVLCPVYFVGIDFLFRVLYATLAPRRVSAVSTILVHNFEILQGCAEAKAFTRDRETTVLATTALDPLCQTEYRCNASSNLHYAFRIGVMARGALSIPHTVECRGKCLRDWT